MRLPRSRAIVPVLILVLGMILLGVGLVSRQSGAGQASAIGGPFALIDQKGRPVSDADVKGRPFLVFFGYTHCPDVCPTTLSDISQMLKTLGPDAKATVLFVTIDPARDTPAVLDDYLSSFDPRIVGLTGDPAAVEKVEREYRVYAKRAPGGADDAYAMDHTAIVYLMDKSGAFVESFNVELEKPTAAAATFAKYM